MGLQADQIDSMPTTTARTVTRQRAGSDILIQIVSRVANLALGTVVTAMLVRTLGSSLYGQWSTLFFVLGLVGFFASFGIEEVAIREAVRDPEHELEWLGSVLAVRMLALVPVMVTSLLAVLVLRQSHEMLIAGIVMVVAMPFGGLSATALIFRLRVDNRVPMIVLTLRSVLWGIAVLITYLEHGTMIVLAISLVSTNALADVYQLIAARKAAGGLIRPNLRHVRKLVTTAMPVGISGVLVISYSRIDQVIVFVIQGSTAAGLYGSVNMLLDSAHFVPGSILTTMAPVIAASWPHDPERMRSAARQTLELLCIGSFGALAFATVAAGPVVGLVFGHQFAGSAKVLPVLSGAFVLMSFGYLVDNLMLVFGKQRRRVRIGLVALLVNVAGNLALVPAFGYVAAAWMTLATEAIVIAMASRVVLAELGPRRFSIGRLGRTAACAVLLGGELAVARALSAPLGVLVALACISYPALLIALGGMSRDDVLTILRRRAVA